MVTRRRGKATVLKILCLFCLCIAGFAAHGILDSYHSVLEAAPLESYEGPGADLTAEDGSGSDRFIPDAAALREQNPGYLGWLEIPMSEVSLPVVTAPDNDFYLKHGFDGNYSVFGCLFLDARLAADDVCRVIHGHNMGVGRTEMFSPLLSYQDTNWAKEHSRLYFHEADKVTEYELLAVVNFDLSHLDEMNYIRGSFESEAEYMDFVGYLTARSSYAYTGELSSERRLLILSTCNWAYGKDNRLLVCAVEREPGPETGSSGPSTET